MQKGIGLALILSGLVLLVLKSVSIPEAQESWDAWSTPNSGTLLFIGAVAAELLLLAARFGLGCFVYTNRELGPWSFYPLVVLVAISGASGIVLVTACLALRFSQGKGHAAKT